MRPWSYNDKYEKVWFFIDNSEFHQFLKCMHHGVMSHNFTQTIGSKVQRLQSIVRYDVDGAHATLNTINAPKNNVTQIFISHTLQHEMHETIEIECFNAPSSRKLLFEAIVSAVYFNKLCSASYITEFSCQRLNLFHCMRLDLCHAHHLQVPRSTLVESKRRHVLDAE